MSNEDLIVYDDSLENIKDVIRENIRNVSSSFNAIGFYLKEIRDRELHREAGYTSILDFAHAEFGISQSWANRWMDINDRFSVGGNSPVLQEKYNGFGSSLLAEMITLSDAQLEQVTSTTTRAAIREMKPKRKKSLAPAQVNQDLSEEEQRKIRYQVLKEMCDSICIMYSFILEKNRYSMKTIQELHSPDHSFGFGNDETGHSKYDAKCKNTQYHVKEFNGTGKWLFEPGEVDQQIWNFNGRDWTKEHPAVIEELHNSVDFTRSIDSLAKEHEAKGSCPKNVGSCIRNGEEGEEGKKICLKCWKGWLSREKFLTAGREANLDIPTFEEDGEAYGATTSNIIVSLVKEMVNLDLDIEYMDGIYDIHCNAFGFDYYAYNTENDGYITIKCEDKKPIFRTSIDRFRNEYECFKTSHPDIVSLLKEKKNKEPEIIPNDREKIESIIETVEPDTADNFNVQEDIILTKEILEKKQEDLKKWTQATKNNRTKSDVIIINKLKIEIAALAAFIHDLDNIIDPIPEPELPAPKKLANAAMDWFDKGSYGDADFYLFHARKELADNYKYERNFYPDYYNDNRMPQPELPKLRNNEQRKEWINNYTSWPVWIDLPHTGEKFYRYDLSKKVAIVVKVSRKHVYDEYKETKDYEYGAEQYYLLGVKYQYRSDGAIIKEDDTRTFYECNTNRSALIDYIKEFQKNNN